MSTNNQTLDSKVLLDLDTRAAMLLLAHWNPSIVRSLYQPDDYYCVIVHKSCPYQVRGKACRYYDDDHIIIGSFAVADLSSRTAEQYLNLKQFKPTTDSASADALDDYILAKLPMGYDICYDGGMYWMNRPDQEAEYSTCFSDKKICRVMFALKNFET